MPPHDDTRKPQEDLYSPYEIGLRRLLDQMERDHPRYLETLLYFQRLTEEINEARLHGDTEVRKANRSKLIYQLNAFTLSVLGLYFTELCDLNTLPSQQTSPDASLAVRKPQAKDITQRLDRLCKTLRENRFNNPRRKPTVLVLGSRLSIEGSMSAFRQIVDNATGDPEDFDSFYNKVGNVDDLDERFRLFRCHLVGTDEIPSGYRTLAKLIKWNYFPLILTTNYDDLLERSLVEEGLGPGDFAVFSIGIAGLSEEHQNIVRWSLPTLDPPVKIIKINGDLATRNMAWTRDQLEAIRDAYDTILKRWLTGPVLLVASGPADESILWSLRDPGESKGDSYKHFWIVDSKRNLLDEDRGLRNAFNLRNGFPEVATDHFIIVDPKYGEPEGLFSYLADRLVEEPAPVKRFNAENDVPISRDGKRPESCRTLWKDFESVDFLRKAKEAGVCFFWRGLTIPFWILGQHKQWPERGFRLDDFDFIELPGDLSLRSEFELRYKELLVSDQVQRGGEGCEWNESRIRLTQAERLADGRWQFHWQKLKYFSFRATNLDLQRQLRAALKIGEFRDGMKLELGAARNILENGYIPSFEWFRDFKKCWLGGAVGTGVIVIGKNGKGLVAQRDPGLKQDAQIYQLSGTGGVDPVEDRFSGKVDIFHSAYRETYYESGLKIPKGKFICVNWGIDLMIGHPLFNFIAFTDDVDITTAATKFRPERFEVEKFRWVDLQDEEHVREFLDNVEVSSNNAVLIIQAHEWVKEHPALFGK